MGATVTIDLVEFDSLRSRAEAYEKLTRDGSKYMCIELDRYDKQAIIVTSDAMAVELGKALEAVHKEANGYAAKLRAAKLL